MCVIISSAPFTYEMGKGKLKGQGSVSPQAGRPRLQSSSPKGFKFYFLVGSLYVHSIYWGSRNAQITLYLAFHLAILGRAHTLGVRPWGKREL